MNELREKIEELVGAMQAMLDRADAEKRIYPVGGYYLQGV